MMHRQFSSHILLYFSEWQKQMCYEAAAEILLKVKFTVSLAYRPEVNYLFAAHSMIDVSLLCRHVDLVNRCVNYLNRCFKIILNLHICDLLHCWWMIAQKRWSQGVSLIWPRHLFINLWHSTEEHWIVLPLFGRLTLGCEKCWKDKKEGSLLPLCGNVCTSHFISISCFSSFAE